MKILRVVTTADAVRYHLRNTLIQSKNTDDIVVVGDGVEQYKSTYPDIRFINLHIARKINFLNDIQSLFKLVCLFSKERPDIVHSIMPKSGLLSSIAGFITRIPVRLHTFTGQTWAHSTGIKKAVLIFMDKLTVFLNTQCMTDSISQSKFLFENGIANNGAPLKVLGNGSLSGVDLEVFDSSKLNKFRKEYRVKLGIADDDTVFIYLGRKCEDKGLIELIKAFAKVNHNSISTKLILVGPDESTSKELKTLMSALPTNVINLPTTNAPEQILSVADIFCIPSHREGFGTVVIEAASLGLPTIGTRIPGLKDSIIENETGLLVELKNEDQLATAMLRLCTDAPLRKSLSENAKKNAIENYDSRKLYQLLRDFYKQFFRESNVIN